MNIKRNISIIGGAGHVGFPLGLIFSSKGFNVSLIDKHSGNIDKINSGKVPFLEEDSENLLERMIKKKKIFATNHLNEVKKSKGVISVVTYDDIPGRNDVGPVFDGDPIFPKKKLSFMANHYLQWLLLPLN